MIPVDPSDTLAVLRAAEAWLSDREHWTQGAYWRDERHATTIRDLVRCTCAIGALSFVAGSDVPRTPSTGVQGAYRALLGATHRPIATLNDEDGYEAVMTVYRKAIEKLEATA